MAIKIIKYLLGFFVVLTIIPTSWCFPASKAPIPQGRAPISISPPGSINVKFHVDAKDTYRLEFYFATEGHPSKELIKIIGNGSIGVNDKQGVKIPVSWEIESLSDGRCVSKQEVITKNSSAGLAGYYVRDIEAIGLNPGDYELKFSIVNDVPEFSGFNAQAVLEHSNGFISNDVSYRLILDIVLVIIDLVLGIALAIAINLPTSKPKKTE